MNRTLIKKRILVAEDDEDDQRFFHDFLHDRDDIILMPIAENGEMLIESLEHIRERSELPHLIILDQNMPKRNGLQTLQILKTDTRFTYIPVVIYSTYTDEALVKRGSEMGACLVVSKPLTKEGYDKMIDDLLGACV